jgi:WD40 repeat protein
VSRAAVFLPASPYKGLVPFEDSELDALFFFGRERETGLVTANLMAARLTVLYGPIGVGKSSLVRAGVAHTLREQARASVAVGGSPEFGVVVFSSWREEPVAAIEEATESCARALLGDVDPPRRGGSLAETLARWAEVLGGELYLILDQTEEYFLYHGREGDEGFLDALADVVNRPELRVNVLLGVRDDALATLDAFKTRIPRLFSNYLRLDHLDRESGRSAIVGPLEQYHRLGGERWTAEPELVDTVLDQVSAGRIDYGLAGRGVVEAQDDRARVEAAYLQLVLERLWQVERERGSTTLQLATLRELGGAGRIVEEHLERALAGLDEQEKETAASLFNYLVTPSGTKIAHAFDDLARYADTDEPRLRAVVDRLAAERIVRPLADGDGRGPRYEIFHDVLADAVLAWRTRFEAERELARTRAEAAGRHRRLVILSTVSLAGLAIMAAIAIFALSQRGEARKERAAARVEARHARARALEATAVSQLAIDPELSLLLADRAARLAPSAQAADVLRDALLASRVRGVMRTRGPVATAEFSPDGKRIVVAGAGGGARVYDARGHLVETLAAVGRLTGAGFSPDGRLIVTTGRDGVARVWNAETGQQLRELRHDGSVNAAAFSPDSGRIATGSADRTVRVWDARSGRLLATLANETAVRRVTWSPDGTRVLTVGTDSYARVFDAASGARVASLFQGGRVTSAAYSPTGSLIVTAGLNRTARVWDPVGGRLLAEVQGHKGPVLALAIAPRGKLFATASTDGDARVWTTHLPRPRFVTPLIGHTNYVTDVAFSPDGFSVVTASRDRTARVWKPGLGNVRAVLAGHTGAVTTASFRSDGRRVLTASDDGTARLWDPQTQPELRLLRRFGGAVDALDRPAGGRVLGVAAANGAFLVDTASGRIVRRLGGREHATDVAFSGDGRLVAVATPHRVVLRRSATGDPLRTFASPIVVTAVDLSSAGDEVAIADTRGDVQLWSGDGRLLRVLRGHTRAVTSVAFSPDDQRIATGSIDRTARIWDARTGKLLHVLRGHENDVTSVAFSRDDRFLVTASRDKDARTWDVRSGDPLRVLVGHFAVVSDASFSPDGRWVVTAGPATAGLWDASSGRLVLYLRGHQGRLTSALFTGARGIITGGVDGTIRTYRCETCASLRGLIALADQRLALTGRTLTPAERGRYVGG